MAEHDDLDRLLDNALSTYAEAGDHLAPRVLARVSAKRVRRLRWVWAAGFATAAAAAALLFLIAPWRVQRTAPASRMEAIAVPTPSEPPLHAETPHRVRRAAAPVRQARTARAVAVSHPFPKEEMFPAPRALSAEESALVHLVNTSSPDQRERLSAMQQATQPINISAISIPPLSISLPAEGKE